MKNFSRTTYSSIICYVWEFRKSESNFLVFGSVKNLWTVKNVLLESYWLDLLLCEFLGFNMKCNFSVGISIDCILNNLKLTSMKNKVCAGDIIEESLFANLFYLKYKFDVLRNIIRTNGPKFRIEWVISWHNKYFLTSENPHFIPPWVFQEKVNRNVSYVLMNYKVRF